MKLLNLQTGFKDAGWISWAQCLCYGVQTTSVGTSRMVCAGHKHSHPIWIPTNMATLLPH